MSETRVVLVKPGDVLIFGNLGDCIDTDEAARQLGDAFNEIKTTIGLKQVVAFEADIDLAAIPRDGA